MAVRIQLRRDSAENWELNNPILAQGEIGLDLTTGNFKIGNGVNQWTQLNYFSVEVEDVISQQQLNDAIAAIGGDGLVFDSQNGVYDIDLSQVSQDIIPNTDETYDLGSSSKRWNDLYLSGNTIFLGDIQLKDNGDGTFGVFGTDGETTLETVLLEGQVTDFELSDEAGNIKARFTEHKEAAEGRLDTVEGRLDTAESDISNVEGRLDVIEGDDETPGSIEKALADAKAYTGLRELAITTAYEEAIDEAKLALGTNFSVADIEERDALEDLTIGDIVFVEDDGDDKWAQYKVISIDPLAFVKLMDEDVLLNSLSAESIKNAYESNEDTNAFTDAYVNKLESIQENAKDDQNADEVPYDNVNSQINANNVQDALDIIVTITEDIAADLLDHINDPILNFTQEQIIITESQISDLKDYEVVDATILRESDIGNKVEAFDQTILRSSDIGITVQAFDAETLKSSDIGITVQPYDFNTVIDSNYETFNSSGNYENLRAQATTAEDIGLGNVENYPMSSQVQAEEGNAENKYMSPLRTKQAILSQVPIYLTNNSFIDETAIDLKIASVGGDGIIWNTSNLKYDLDYATEIEAFEGTSQTKVLTPANSKFIVIDGGEFN